jgi:hypothetical protein
MIRFFTLAFFIGFVFAASAQRQCGTVDYKRSQPAISLNTPVSSGNGRDTVADEIINIPVVIHVLYNTAEQNISNEQIQSQLDALNLDFRKQNYNAKNIPPAFAALAGDARINFTLARTDPQGRPTTGVIRKSTSLEFFTANDEMKFSGSKGDNAWDGKSYLNIWVCNLFGRSLGYASLPGTDVSKDGIVVQYTAFGTTGTAEAPFNKGRTLTHEAGHWLGLMHIWGDDNCGDDKIGDTPPQQSYHNGCPSFPQMSACSVNSNGDMFMNFMDFTNDDCMSMFTIGQKNKMRSLFAKGNARNGILNSAGSKEPTGDAAPVVTDTTRAIPEITFYPNPAKDKITFINKSGEAMDGEKVHIYNMSGREVLVTEFTSENPSVTVNKLSPGIYIIKIGTGKSTTNLKLVKN